MDYVKFYGMEAEPFRNDPDRRFYFEGNAPAQARIRLLRGLWQCKGLCVLIGGPGAGKTTLARHLLDSLNGKNRTVRLLAIPHSACDAGWVLPRIAAAFGVARPATGAMGLLGQILEQFARIKAAGSHPVLFIDEAQMLRNREVMEEFRGLLNLEHKGAKLLSLVLLGLPDLSEVLHLDEPLAQRVDIRIQLGLLDGNDTAEYIKHRLSCVGGAPGLFSEDAIEAIHRYSRGVPRTINTLCDNALFEAYLARQKSIDGSLVTQVARDLDLAPEEKAEASPARDAAREAPEQDLVHELASQGLAMHDAPEEQEVEHDLLLQELPSQPTSEHDVLLQELPSQPTSEHDVLMQELPSQPAPEHDVLMQELPSQPAPEHDVLMQEQPAPQPDVPTHVPPRQAPQQLEVPMQELPSQPAPEHDVLMQEQPRQAPQQLEVPMQELPSQPAPQAGIPMQEPPRRAAPQPAVPQPEPQPSPSVAQRPQQGASEAAPRPQVVPPAPNKPTAHVEAQPMSGSDAWAPPRKPSTPLTPPDADLDPAPATQVWDSPILEEPEHELSFSDDGQELSLEAAEQLAESTPAPAPEPKEPPTLSSLSDGPDPDGETSDTLAGLVMEMDEDWRSQPPQREPQPQASPQPQAPPQPQASPRPQTPPQPQAGPRPQAPPQPQAGPRPQASPQPQAGPRPQASPQPQAGPRPQPQPQADQRAAVEPPGRPQSSDLVDALFDEIQLD